MGEKGANQSVLAPKEFAKLSGFRETVVRSNHRIPVGGQTLLLPDVLFLVEIGQQVKLVCNTAYKALASHVSLLYNSIRNWNLCQPVLHKRSLVKL